MTEDWGWCLDMPEEFPHHLYVLLRAADRYRASFGCSWGRGRERERERERSGYEPFALHAPIHWAI